MELKYYIYIFNQSVIWRVRGLEVIRHLARSRVRGDCSFAHTHIYISYIYIHQYIDTNSG